MSKIAVVYHSGHGHTEVIAKDVAKGAETIEGTEVKLVLATEVDDYWETLHEADTIVMGSPTYMGSVSAPFKEFIDKTGKFYMDQPWKDKLAAGFTNSSAPSGDKLNVLIQMAVLAAQQNMLWISLGFRSHLPPTEDGLVINRLGGYMGLMTQGSPFDNLENSPNRDDRYTAELFGTRIAEITKRWAK